MKITRPGFWIFIILFNNNLNAQNLNIDGRISILDSMRLTYGLTELKDSIDFQRFVDSLMTSANHATNQRKFEKAIVYLNMGEDAAIHYIGENSIAHARILYSFGFSYARNNEFVKAEPYLERALKIYENFYGNACEKCAKTLNTLGFVYHFQGKYDKVEGCLEKSVSIYEKLYGKYQSDYINSLNSLCIFLKETGQYEKALQKFPELLELNEKVFSKKNNNYISALINFSNLLVELDQFERAEELRLEAVQISENLNGKQNVTYAQALFALATFYKSINQTEKAERNLLETQGIYENLNLTNLPEYARVLNNLGNLYVAFNNYEIAERYLMNANKILETVLGKKHFEYGQSLESIGVLKMRMGLFNEAERLISEALEIKLASRGKNEDYTNTLMLLANVYKTINKVEEAQTMLEESLNIRQQLFGNQHKAIAESFKALSDVHEIKANYHLADSFRLAYFSIVQAIFRKAMNYMSIKQLKQYSENYLLDLDNSIQCYFKRNSDSKVLAEICYNSTLFYKGFLLNELMAQKSILRKNPNLKDRYNLFQTYSRQLAAQLTKPVVEQKNIAELEDKMERLEKEFAKELSTYGHNMHLNSWQDIRQSLGEGEAVIEFVHYGNEKDSINYAALIVTKQSLSPSLIPLFKEHQLTAIIDNVHKRRLHSENIYNFSNDAIANRKNSLYELIWHPLIPYLTSINSIYISPAGLLHRINLSAINDNYGYCMMDHYKIISVNSTRQVNYNAMETEKSWNSQALLMGGIQYEFVKEQNKQEPSSSSLIASATRSLSYEIRDSTYKISSWTYLPGTLKEVKKLANLLHAAKFETKLYTSNEATESFCKKYELSSTSPRILHFATHGFFYPDQKKQPFNHINSFPVFQQSKDPMVRSGLILANANFAWKHGYIHESLEDDGVLTALEVSLLNLSNTELVVLSACETGLGDIKGNEGVYGLQRAFKIAGAKYLMMSLWQVPDRETKEFMISFYKNWLQKKKSIPDAFRKTQKEMRERFINPYAWAGFMLVE